jgi:hypothetical protein
MTWGSGTPGNNALSSNSQRLWGRARTIILECLPLRRLFRVVDFSCQRKDTILQIPNISAVRVDLPTTCCQDVFVLFCFVLFFETRSQKLSILPDHGIQTQLWLKKLVALRAYLYRYLRLLDPSVLRNKALIYLEAIMGLPGVLVKMGAVVIWKWVCTSQSLIWIETIEHSAASESLHLT